jgi:hypothetical protein
LAQEKENWARAALALGLAKVAGRLEPAVAARECAEPARSLSQALAQEKDAGARAALAQGLAAVSDHLESAAAIRLCADAARLLNEALREEENRTSTIASALGQAGGLQHLWQAGWTAESMIRAENRGAAASLQSGLLAVAWRLEPAEATRVYANAAWWLYHVLQQKKADWGSSQVDQGQAAAAWQLAPAKAVRLLTYGLAQEKVGQARWPWAEAIAAEAGRLEPAEAARVCAEAARLLHQALAQEKHAGLRRRLAEEVAAVAGRLEPAEASRLCREAARLLDQALAQEKDGPSRSELAAGLASVLERLEPATAARLRAEAARSQIQAHIEGRQHLGPAFMAGLLQALDGEEAARVARAIALRMVADPKFQSPQVLDDFLCNGTHREVRQRAAAFAGAIVSAAHGPVPSLPLLAAAGQPLPCRLTTQDLVELLKMPTCIGGVRRVILNQLGNRYGHRFATHWDFVRYAQQQGLNLDFTTPPKRPDRALPKLFKE